jgi:truncated hemoglobin YjbI
MSDIPTPSHDAKAFADTPAMLSNLMFSNIIANTNISQQNAVANQQAMNELGISVTGKTVNVISNLGPAEARSAVDVLTNNELAQTIADLKATIEAFTGGSRATTNEKMESEIAAGNGTASVQSNEREAVIRNLELATIIFNANIEQQNIVANQHAASLVRIAVVGKCVDLILAIDPHAENAAVLLREYRALLELFDQKLS